MDEIRINKYLAECGVCSRREADRLIAEGRVEVEGRVAVSGMKISPDRDVRVDGQAIARRKPVVWAFYKPVGVTCTERDPYADKTLRDVVKVDQRVTYAGRLDRDSEGLLLLSNDGNLIEAMMRGSHGHEKEYVVEVDKRITEDFVGQMEEGVWLEELERKTRPCRVVRLGANRFRIILTQGLNRQIRRMCRALGYKVTGLKRIRIVNIKLGNLAPGALRPIEGRELEDLYEAVGMKDQAEEKGMWKQSIIKADIGCEEYK